MVALVCVIITLVTELDRDGTGYPEVLDTSGQRQLGQVPRDGQKYSRDLPSFGDHRLTTKKTRLGDTLVVGLPKSDLDRTQWTVGDLLLLARLDSGRPLETESMDLSRLAVDAVNDARSRGERSRSRATGSTGLGLAIVAAVVAAHGGTISVASAPGHTEFTVVLPGVS